MGESRRSHPRMTEHSLPECLIEVLEFCRSHVLADTTLRSDFEELYREIARRIKNGGESITYGEAVQLLRLDPELRQSGGLRPVRTRTVPMQPPQEFPLGVPRFRFVHSDPRFFVLWLTTRVILVVYSMKWTEGREDELKSRLSGYVARAASEQMVWDALKQTVQWLRNNQVTLPGELEAWVLDAFTERCPRPVQRGRNAFRKAVRNAGIVLAIKRLITLGMKPTRNDASTPVSACDALAEVLTDGSAPIGYEAIAKI